MATLVSFVLCLVSVTCGLCLVSLQAILQLLLRGVPVVFVSHSWSRVLVAHAVRRSLIRALDGCASDGLPSSRPSSSPPRVFCPAALLNAQGEDGAAHVARVKGWVQRSEDNPDNNSDAHLDSPRLAFEANEIDAPSGGLGLIFSWV